MAREHQQGTRKSVRHATDSEGGTGTVVSEEGQLVRQWQIGVIEMHSTQTVQMW